MFEFFFFGWTLFVSNGISFFSFVKNVNFMTEEKAARYLAFSNSNAQQRALIQYGNGDLPNQNAVRPYKPITNNK